MAIWWEPAGGDSRVAFFGRKTFQPGAAGPGRPRKFGVKLGAETGTMALGDALNAFVGE